MLFKIKILDKEYLLDEQMENFSATDNKAVGIPVGQFRYKDGDWYILWNKELNRYYLPPAQSSVLSIPLGVEWLKVVFQEHKPGVKNLLDLLVLLSESLCLMKDNNHAGKPNKGHDRLKKMVCQLNLAIRKNISSEQ